ncbi:MAG: hypothetical protein Ta2D_06880 [Rickettsiales bacterium]|nr:MAG: hypothetical protein Ta2D_06880 [Rickettsiales bacterium]
MESNFGLMLVLFIVFSLFIGYIIIQIPIKIAEHRNLKDDDMKIIKILSWMGIILGFTWMIALILSLVYSSNLNINIKNNPDELKKMHDLLKEGVITQEEFDNYKKKMML